MQQGENANKMLESHTLHTQAYCCQVCIYGQAYCCQVCIYGQRVCTDIGKVCVDEVRDVQK